MYALCTPQSGFCLKHCTLSNLLRASAQVIFFDVLCISYRLNALKKENLIAGAIRFFVVISSMGLPKGGDCRLKCRKQLPQQSREIPCTRRESLPWEL